MFEVNPEVAEAVEAVYLLASTLGRGDVLAHSAISKELGLGPHEGYWGRVVSKVRRRLQEERGIATWPVPMVGYRLLTREEQLQLPEWRMRRGLRQVRRGRGSLLALPEKGLTLHQRRSRMFMLDRMKETE